MNSNLTEIAKKWAAALAVAFAIGFTGAFSSCSKGQDPGEVNVEDASAKDNDPGETKMNRDPETVEEYEPHDSLEHHYDHSDHEHHDENDDVRGFKR